MPTSATSLPALSLAAEPAAAAQASHSKSDQLKASSRVKRQTPPSLSNLERVAEQANASSAESLTDPAGMV